MLWIIIGLFHKAIMESATPLNLWGVSPPGWAKRWALAVSTIAGCPLDPKQMIKCLKEVPANVLVNLYNNFFVSTSNSNIKEVIKLKMHTYLLICAKTFS